MLIYGVSGISAHKKTVKQVLQPMIEQVFGGGGGGAMYREDVPLFFGSAFQSYYIFVSIFFDSPMHFLGRFYQYLHFCFAVYYAYFIKKSVFWTQNFPHVQLILNFLRHPAWL